MYQSKWAPQPAEEEGKKQEEAPTETPTEQAPPEPVASPSNPAFALSGSATTFSPVPAPPPPDVSSVDTFAQTAGQDDLFGDEVEPVDQSMRVRSEDDLFSDDFTPAEQPIVEQAAPEPGPPRAEAPRGRGRGRGRGGGAGSRGGAAAASQNQAAQQKSKPPTEAESAPPENAPSGPCKEATLSVTGDRQATGGVKKPKLTEEELAEKMANIKIKNASLTAAHARAEADAASFAEREDEAKRVAAQRQKEERRDRQQMMGEREKNRARKLKAMEGREWDSEKQEDDFRRGGRHDKKGGFAGDQEGYTDGREYLYREPRGAGRGERGGKHGGKSQEQTAPKQEDFPSLPASSKDSELASQQSPKLKIEQAAGSWADEVESAN